MGLARIGVTASGLIFTPTFYTLMQRFRLTPAAPRPRDAGRRVSSQSNA
jgi:hypothetical protein